MEFSYDAVAAAYGVDVTVNNPSLPLGLTVEVAGPVAQSHLSSVNQSDGFASFPYFSDAVQGLPALVKGAILPGFPIPELPQYASSSLGQPAANNNYPGITLQSSSTQHATSSSATAGVAATGYVSTSSIIEEDSQVTATATTTANLLQVGPLLTLGALSSTATAVLGSDGKVTTSSSMSIGRIIVPGLDLTLPFSTPSPIPVPVPVPGIPSFPIPLPPINIPFGGLHLIEPNIGFEDGQFTVQIPLLGKTKFAIPTAPLFAALNALGIDVSFQKAIVTPGGVVASNLVITTTLPALPANQYFNGATPLSFTFGRASASFAGASAAPINSGFVLPPSPPEIGGNGSPVGGTVDGGTSLPPSTGDLGGTTGETISTTPVTSDTMPSAGSLPSATAGTPTRMQVLAMERKLFSSLEPLYVAVLGIGVIAVFAAQFLRYLGVRSSWKF